jgi:VanZ family protein
MHKLVSIIAIGFFSFILWVIYLANTGSSSVLFSLIKSIPYGDKVGHTGLYGTLTLLSIIALKFKTLNLGKVSFYYGAGLVFVFVLCEEFSQLFIPSRTFDYLDMSANFFGIFIASLIAFLIEKRLSTDPSEPVGTA